MKKIGSEHWHEFCKRKFVSLVFVSLIFLTSINDEKVFWVRKSEEFTVFEAEFLDIILQSIARYKPSLSYSRLIKMSEACTH